MQTSLAPWLTVADGHHALSFYQLAFGAREVYRHEGPDGSLIVRLTVGAAEFWVSGGASGSSSTGGTPLGGESIRMILTVDSPDALFKQALDAGASEIFPVGEGHGWRLGRLVDPFGLHWEIGHPL